MILYSFIHTQNHIYFKINQSLKFVFLICLIYFANSQTYLVTHYLYHNSMIKNIIFQICIKTTYSIPKSTSGIPLNI